MFVSMIRNLVLRGGAAGVLVFAGLLLMVGVASALFMGTATSSENTVSALGADIKVRGESDAYSSSVTGSLNAIFRGPTQKVFAGFIDVKNNGTEAFQNGYTIANVANPPPSSPADTALNNALRVVIEQATLGSPLPPLIECALEPGTVLQEVVQSETAWAGLTTGNITAINGPGAEQRLCFYLILDGAPNDVSGGEVRYDLTFTAS